MPSHHFREGDTCGLITQIVNYSNQDLQGIPLFVLLDVYGEFWFWPSWSQVADFKLINVPMGSQALTIKEPFI